MFSVHKYWHLALFGKNRKEVKICCVCLDMFMRVENAGGGGGGCEYLHFWSGRGARLFRVKGRSLNLGLFGERCCRVCPGNKTHSDQSFETQPKANHKVQWRREVSELLKVP